MSITPVTPIICNPALLQDFFPSMPSARIRVVADALVAMISSKELVRTIDFGDRRFFKINREDIFGAVIFRLKDHTQERKEVIRGATKIRKVALFVDENKRTLVSLACMIMQQDIGEEEWLISKEIKQKRGTFPIEDYMLLPFAIQSYVSKKTKEKKCRLYYPFANRDTLLGFKGYFTQLFLYEKLVSGFGRSILQSIEFLHSHQLAHRDLKLKNFVVSEPMPRRFQIFLIDFLSVSPFDKGGEFEYKEISTTYSVLPPEVFLEAGHVFESAYRCNKSVEDFLERMKRNIKAMEKEHRMSQEEIEGLANYVERLRNKIEKAKNAQSEKLDIWGTGIVLSSLFSEYFRANPLSYQEDRAFWEDVRVIKCLSYYPESLLRLVPIFTEPGHLQEPKNPILHYLWKHFFQVDPKKRSSVTVALQEWNNLFSSFKWN